MSSNLDYLDPNLVPLEQKVIAYLEAEEDLRQAEVEARSLQSAHPSAAEVAANNFIQNIPPVEPPRPLAEVQQQIQRLQQTIAQLRDEVMQLLPARDEWVKVNLGYGPSRVGAFRLDNPKPGQPEYMLRVVH
ncbi:hypothetical protein [Solirubrum puertoriconensis]|uniref:Uncharacterized protein n=1 Tax=Solirubrum puertoriconensis TaxID=1751427 RepID=A0A9X0L4C6_SOLP1|nr:hypothetical protein [Solirubrum puertoriconensis]KUG07465.1 hypothetical protein ASU33_14040 [Solirubrum puertoriconensis]